MTFTQSVKTCFRKYAVFHGRASRAEYGWWVLALLVGFMLSMILDSIVGIYLFNIELPQNNATIPEDTIILDNIDVLGLFFVIFFLGTCLPSLAVTVRRLHDINRKGWWVLWWWLIAICVPIIMLSILALSVAILTILPFPASGALEDYPIIGIMIVMLLMLLTLIALPLGVGLLIAWWTIWLTGEGTKGDNRFGADPLASIALPATNDLANISAISTRKDKRDEMTFERSIKTCFKKYAIFHGRASRSEFWWWFLFYSIFIQLPFTVDLTFNTFLIDMDMSESVINFLMDDMMLEAEDIRESIPILGFFTAVFMIVTFLPFLAVTVRRLHDINRSGWWVLVWYLIMAGLAIMANLGGWKIALSGFVILVIWEVVWHATKGTEGDNRFGSNPLASA